jgi:CheY-like chemotaxis protein
MATPSRDDRHREECLAADMDDCVTQPIRVETLVLALVSPAPRSDA